MITDTVKEKIAKNLYDTLTSITEGNGYRNTVLSVQRWNKNGNNTKDCPCIIIWPGQETKTPDPHPLYSCKWQVQLEVFIRQKPDSEVSTDEIVNGILGDIERALIKDVSRGGNAVDTILLGNDPFQTIEGSANGGINIDIEIHYRHLQSDPETAA